MRTMKNFEILWPLSTLLTARTRRSAKIVSLIAVAAWLSTAGAPCHADSMTPISPLEGVEAVQIEVLIGGALDPDEDTGGALRLFSGDVDRAADLRVALREEVSEVLGDCAVEVSSDAKDVLHVMIYGRSLELPDHETYQLSLLEVRVLKDSEADCECDTGEVPAIQTNLVFTEDEDLEGSLVSQVRVILTETAGCRASGV